MKELKSEGAPGYSYRHFIENNITPLKELQRQYEAMAYRTWIYRIDGCDPKWELKVEKITI